MPSNEGKACYDSVWSKVIATGSSPQGHRRADRHVRRFHRILEHAEMDARGLVRFIGAPYGAGVAFGGVRAGGLSSILMLFRTRRRVEVESEDVQPNAIPIAEVRLRDRVMKAAYLVLTPDRHAHASDHAGLQRRDPSYALVHIPRRTVLGSRRQRRWSNAGNHRTERPGLPDVRCGRSASPVGRQTSEAVAGARAERGHCRRSSAIPRSWANSRRARCRPIGRQQSIRH
jgi:hypothetical protein